MANIPIRDIPGPVVATPGPTNLIAIDNGVIMQRTTIANAVNAALPLASQSSAETGTNNSDRMSPLRTKQAIDAQVPTIVTAAITALNLGTMSQEDASDYTPTSGLAAVALSNSYTDLSNLPTLGTAAATDASDYATAAQGALADTAIQPGNAALVPAGGTTGQVLVKNSGTNYDTGWVSSAAATAVSYAPQTLTDSQQEQARENIDADDPWWFKPLGEPVAIFDNITGVEPPPTDKGYRYVELTAGLITPGAYNDGVLTSESVSGAAPRVMATAVISDAASPMNGATIRLINTERRFVRPGSSGTVQEGTTRQHQHVLPVSASNSAVVMRGTQTALYGTDAATNVAVNAYGSGVSTTTGPAMLSSSNLYSEGTGETSPRSVGATYYMRIR